jgi:hypothetical protein
MLHAPHTDASTSTPNAKQTDNRKEQVQLKGEARYAIRLAVADSSPAY